MDEQKQKLIERIKQAQNILVTVSANPSVDQLAAAIGLTLVLNQLGKHGTAVFSGSVPSTIEFLKPEDTLEKNTDSLRDFIIALDKSKADKLRYKVEDEVVRIFITPYRTSLSEHDLDFSQGDFNVDVVVCLGVTEQQDLDTAITAHGRILHDATVVSVSTVGQGSLGSINWVDPTASSLSEMVAGLTDGLDKKAMNGQIATALLTGIVATTERFRNDKTSPKTMSASAALMAAGANQQLIATELETPAEIPQADEPEPEPERQNDSDEPAPKRKSEPGTLEIAHDEPAHDAPEPEGKPEPEPEPEPERPQIHVDENGELLVGEQLPGISSVRGVAADGAVTDSGKTEVKRELMTKMPELASSNLTANTEPEMFDPPTEELTLPSVEAPMLTHNESVLAPFAPPPLPPPPAPPESATPAWQPPAPAPQPVQPAWQPPAVPPVEPDETLSEIEQSVSSPHLHMSDDAPAATPAAEPQSNYLNDARSAVEAALSGSAQTNPLEPIEALNAQQLGPELTHEAANEQPAAPAPYVPPANLFAPAATPAPSITNTGFSEPTPGTSPADQSLDMPMPAANFGQPQAGGPFTAPSPFPPAPSAPISAFPGTPQQSAGSVDGQTPPPPVPPPMLPPLQ